MAAPFIIVIWVIVAIICVLLIEKYLPIDRTIKMLLEALIILVVILKIVGVI